MFELLVESLCCTARYTHSWRISTVILCHFSGHKRWKQLSKHIQLSPHHRTSRHDVGIEKGSLGHLAKMILSIFVDRLETIFQVSWGIGSFQRTGAIRQPSYNIFTLLVIIYTTVVYR